MDNFGVRVPGRVRQLLMEDQVSTQNNEESRMERLEARIAAVWPVLGSLECTTVVVDYDGYGDSGQMNGADFFSGDNKKIQVKRSIMVKAPETFCAWDAKTESWVRGIKEETELVDLLERIASDIVDMRHAGYENNQGGRGTVTFCSLEKTVTCEHEAFYTASERSEFIFGANDASV